MGIFSTSQYNSNMMNQHLTKQTINYSTNQSLIRLINQLNQYGCSNHNISQYISVTHLFNVLDAGKFIYYTNNTTVSHV